MCAIRELVVVSGQSRVMVALPAWGNGGGSVKVGDSAVRQGRWWVVTVRVGGGQVSVR